MTDDLVARLRRDEAQLREYLRLARKFGGDECDIRVKSPDHLLLDLGEAISKLEVAEVHIRELEEERYELKHGVCDLVEEADYHSGMRTAAEARVRELEAELAGAYERAATWHDRQAAAIKEENGAMCRDGMWPDEGRMEQIKFHTSSAAAIRKLAQEVKHEAE